MSASVIRELFHHLASESEEVRVWAASAIAYAASADKVIHPKETPYVLELLSVLKSEPKASKAVQDALSVKTKPTFEKMQFDEKKSTLLLKIIVEVCASDGELDLDEIQYLNDIATRLNVPYEVIQSIIGGSIHEKKIEYFSKLISDLSNNQKIWLAGVIFKAIYADGVIDNNEIRYFNDIFELLKGSPQLLEELKRDATNKQLDRLPQVKFTKDMATKVLQYLIEIFMSDEEFDDNESRVLISISEYLNVPRAKLNFIIKQTHKMLQGN